MARMTWWFAIGACALAACSSSSETTTTTNGGTDAAVEPIDAAADAPAEAATDAGGACNALANVADSIDQTFVSTTPPTATGGTIVSGTYVMTAFVVYTGADGGVGPTGLKLKETLAIQEGTSGGTYQRARSVTMGGGAPELFDINGEYVHLTGASVQAHETCPEGPTPFNSYDSDGTKLRFYAPAAIGNPALMAEYTKR